MIDPGTTVRQPAVAVVGLGAMGYPIAERLLSHKYDVHAVDYSPDVRDRAARRGILTYDALSSAPRCDVVIVLVATGQQLLDTIRVGRASRDLGHETWVICSTVGPRVAREAADLLVRAGATVLDAPVTGGVPGAEAGTLRFLVSGDSDAIAGVRNVLSVLGTLCPVGEKVGDGQATKIVNQLCSSVHLATAAEAIALAIRLGLDPGRTVSAITGGSGASWFLDERGPRMAHLDTDAVVLTRLAILAKDSALAEHEADMHGAKVPVLKAARRQYQRAAEMGLLEADDSRIIQTYLG